MENYTVQPGDTLGKIAAKVYGNAARYTEIAQANDITNPNLISVGQVLKIPNADGVSESPSPVAAESPTPTPIADSTSDASASGNLTAEKLQLIMPKASSANIEKYLEPLNTQMPKFEINTPMRQAQFIAQLAHESGSFHYNQENLNYSAKALMAVFGKYFPTQALADEYARKPEKIASRVYGNRMGNGDEASGEGWKYRGRGLIQLTGRNNYQKCGEGLGMDLVADPNPVANDPTVAVDAACWFWDSRDLNKYADQDNVKQITRLINGGYNGLADREEYLERAKQALGVS